MKHEIMNVRNPFNAPVFHVRETVSTMAEARLLFAQGEADGTTIYADYQSSGRGRIDGREWSSSPGESLLCTTFLRGQPVRGLTLRVGLALALTFDAFLSPPSRTQIKWPNDVLFQGKKLGGILCENDGSAVYIGTGLNIAQTSFPEELALKASSLALIASGGTSIPVPLPSIEQVLERYLQNLKEVLDMQEWAERIGERLFRRGERISFLSGDPEKKVLLDGYLEGIGTSGEMLFRPAGGGEVLRLFSGEIPYQ